MRTKLLRVRDKLSMRRKDSAVDSMRTNSNVSETNVQPSFLGLPAEIRNDIYQCLATSTTLTLSPASPKKRPSPVGLMLACKQTWKEYRAILLTCATFIISVHSYHFDVVVRTFEKLNGTDLALMKMNESLWIYLQLAHVPSRDDRKALRAWCDYRGDTVMKPYFGTGQRIPQDVIFQYSVKFLTHMRPPRPPSRYQNGFEMKLDLLRTHLRMAGRLRTPEEEEAAPSFELKKMREDFDECAGILQDLSTEMSTRED